MIDEIKTLDGEYDKLNEVLAHGAVDGYGKPFLAQYSLEVYGIHKQFKLKSRRRRIDLKPPTKD